MRWLLAAGMILISLGTAGWRARGDEPGTIGVVAGQLFDERSANHRGPLAVMHVMENSPGEKAAIHCSDFIWR